MSEKLTVKDSPLLDEDWHERFDAKKKWIAEQGKKKSVTDAKFYELLAREVAREKSEDKSVEERNEEWDEAVEDELYQKQLPKNKQFYETLAREIARKDSGGRENDDLENEVGQLRLVKVHLESQLKSKQTELRTERKASKRLRKEKKALVSIIQKHADTIHLNAKDLHFFEIVLDEALTETEKVQEL